jgi:hypothetical protein
MQQQQAILKEKFVAVFDIHMKATHTTSTFPAYLGLIFVSFSPSLYVWLCVSTLRDSFSSFGMTPKLC